MAILGPEYAEERKEAVNLLRLYHQAAEGADRHGSNSPAFATWPIADAADELALLVEGLFGIQEEEL